MSFVYTPRSPLFDLDEHELAALVGGTLPNDVAQMASSFIITLRMSGSQFMQLEDQQLRTLANNNLEALQTLETLRTSPAAYIRGLLSPNPCSPAITLDFRHLEPLTELEMDNEATPSADMAQGNSSIADTAPTKQEDAEISHFFDFEDNPSSFMMSSNVPRSSICASGEPPANVRSSAISETLQPSGANYLSISPSSESVVSCRPTSPVASTFPTSSTCRNSFESRLPIREKSHPILKSSAIGGLAQMFTSNAERSGQLMPPFEGDEEISDSSNADLVVRTPSLVKSTFKNRDGQENHNVAPTTPTPSNSNNPPDGGSDVEEHSPADKSSYYDKNNHSDNNPPGCNPKTTSPTKDGGHGTFSGSRLCSVDDRHSPNLRIHSHDHDEPSNLPQLHTFTSSYRPHPDRDSDPDSGLVAGYIVHEKNPQVKRPSYPNLVPHNYSDNGDANTTTTSDTPPGSSAAPMFPQISGKTPFDASFIAHTFVDNAPIIRDRDVGNGIKPPMVDANITIDPSTERSFPSDYIVTSSSTSSLSAEGARRPHVSSAFLQIPSLNDSTLLPNSQIAGNGMNTSDQTSLALTEKRSENFFSARSSLLASTTAELFAAQDHSVISDTAASCSRTVNFHHEDSLLMTPHCLPVTSRENNSPFCDDCGNMFYEHLSCGCLPECNQSNTMLLPVDNSGYLASNIDSCIYGADARAQNTLQDTCSVLEDGAKQALCSQPKVDVGIVPEPRPAIDELTLQEHLERFEEPYSNVDPAAGRPAHGDAQAFNFAKTSSEIIEMYLPHIPLTPPFSQEISASLDSLSVDRSANPCQTIADSTPMPKAHRSLCKASRVDTPRTLWPISDDFYTESQTATSFISLGRDKLMKRGTKPLSMAPFNDRVMSRQPKSATSFSYADAATQTELECQRTLLKIQTDDLGRDSPVDSSPLSTLHPSTTTFMKGVHKILATVLPKVASKDTSEPLHITNPRPRVDITSRGLLPSPQGPVSAISQGGDV